MATTDFSAQTTPAPPGKQPRAVVIGSSPLMVIEAVMLRRMGWKVTLIDERETIGGAWFARDLWGYKNVEVGCHYLEPCPEVYRYLQSELGLNMLPMNPAPAGIGRGIRLSRDTWRVLLSTYTALRTHKEVLELPGAIKELLRMVFSPPKYYYPEGGCGSITAALHRLLTDAGVEVKIKNRMISVVVAKDKNLATVRSKAGEFQCDRVLFNSSTRFESLLHGTNPVRFRATPRENCHVVLRVRGKKAKPFTFLDIFRDPFVSKISDVAPYVHGDKPPADELLLCALYGGPSRKEFTDAQMIEQAFQAFLRLGLLDKTSQLLEGTVVHFDFTDLPADELARLGNEYAPILIPVQTRNLAFSIRCRLREFGIAR